MILVRLLLVTYLGQKCFVRWNSAESSQFSVQSGVRQKAVLSPFVFSLYVNNLIDLLRASGLGCFVGQMYFRIVTYAYDILQLAPRREALQRMIWISENFMEQHIISFSSTKTKCLHIGESKESIKKVVVFLWVQISPDHFLILGTVWQYAPTGQILSAISSCPVKVVKMFQK